MALKPRHILHVDMDAFYASVEQHDRPELRGKPVLVGGRAEARGVISAASYEARPFGCRSAMPTGTALRLCPHAVLLPVRMDRYLDVSKRIFAIFAEFTPTIEPLSVDEAFLDVSGCQKLLGSPEQIARRIKSRIQEVTGLTASVGAAPNKFLAKLASDLKKPDGLVAVDPQRVAEFLDGLPIGRLWGVGKMTQPKFERLGLRTFGDVRRLSQEQLQRHFGNAGEDFYRLVRGIDDRPVVPDREAKSISSETTFAQDIEDRQHLRAVLLSQIEEVARRLRREKMLARTVHLKIRLPDFATLTRSATLDTPTDQTDVLWNTAAELFERWASQSRSAVRLIGAAASSLSAGGEQLSLFDQDTSRKRRQLDQAVDQIRDKFGSKAIFRGGAPEP